MAGQGADPEALEALAVRFRATADRLATSRAALSARVRGARWDGPDGARFRTRWDSRLRPGLATAEDRCRHAARRLRAEADQQRRASAPVGHPPTGSGHRSTGRAGGPAAVPAPPRHAEVWTIGADGGLGPVHGAVGSSVSVEPLGGGRSRVSVTETSGAGLGIAGGLGAGAAATTGSRRPAAGASAGLVGRLDGTTTRTWTVPDDRVPLLLVAVGADAAVTAGPGRVADRVTHRIGDALAAVGVRTDLGRRGLGPVVPRPERTERLEGITATGWAGVAAGVPLLGGSSGGQVLAGTAVDDAGRTAVLQWTETGEASGAGRLLGSLGVRSPGLHGSVTTRVEVPPGRDPVRVVVDVADGDERTLVRALVDRRAVGALGDHLAAAVTTLAVDATAGAGGADLRGRPWGVLSSVADGAASEGSVRWRVDVGRIERDGGSVPVAIGPVTLAPSAGRVRLLHPG